MAAIRGGRRAALGAAALICLSLVAARLRPFSWAAGVLFATLIVAFAGCLLRSAQRGPVQVRVPARLRAAWMVAVAVLAATELAAYFSRPRTGHPTLSSMADAAMNHYLGRAGLVALWLLVGYRVFWQPTRARS